MTKNKFFFKNGVIVGFEFDGHAKAGAKGHDVVCSAVSSVCYMVANTVTEIYKINAEISERDAYFSFMLKQNDAMRCQEILEGLLLHINEINKDYPKHTQVIKTEV